MEFDKLLPKRRRRILLVDDTPDIHDDIRKILLPAERENAGLEELEFELFGDLIDASTSRAELLGELQLESAYQGDEAIEMASQAVEDEDPYFLAFVDMRMPPGLDGVQTIRELWKVQPGMAVIVCTAYAEYNWESIAESLGTSPNLLILRKPFEPIEILQLVSSMSRRFELEQMAQINSDAMKSMIERQTSRLRRSEAQAKAIIESISDGLIVLNQRGSIVNANPAVSGIFEYPLQDLLGKAVTKLIPSLYPDEENNPFERFLETGTSTLVGQGVRYVLGKTRFLETVHLEMTLSQIHNVEDTRPSFLLICRDITQRMRIEKELRRHRDHLEELVRTRTSAVEEAKEQALNANQAKSLFLANMSHELRTPMNAILGYSEMLIEDAEDADQGDFIPDLRKINTAGRHLLNLINDILDLSKIEAGKMELFPEAFSIEGIVQEVVETVQPMLERNNNTLNLGLRDDLGEMTADLTKFRQILYNLLSNASKFTEEGIVSLIVREEEADGQEWLRFEVSDTGIGMSTEQLEKVFQAFTQADSSTTRKFGGTGLGLTISRKFCLMMGGDITVKSEVGRGSSFTIHLPREMSPPQQPGHEPPIDVTVSGALDDYVARVGILPTVLVIDDDEVVRDMLLRILTRERFRVLTAASGAEGLEMARAVRPAAITLDVMMPDMDGWTVLSELKGDPELADIPVIMLTMVDDKSRGYALGAADYLTKPVERGRLIQMLSRHCTDEPPHSVLVVEDEKEIRDMICRMLKREGWEVAEAANGLQALRQLESLECDVILLDLMMPEMDGFQFIRELRNHPRHAEIPVIVVTAMDLSDAERQRLEGSVREILQKGSYALDELLQVVRAQLKAHTK